MANKKISQLDALGTAPAATDILPITDVSGTPTTKSVTVAELLTNAPDNSTDVTLATVASNYLSINNQEITAGTVPVALGGTGGTDAATARSNLGLGDAATKTVGTADGNVVGLTDVGGTVKLPAVDGSQLLNLPAPEADVDGPLTIALRGTDNPHIGANPDQSFKVMDNPSQSAMVVADPDGNITYLLKSTTAEVKVAKANGSAVRFALASDLPAFVLENDSGEPDIEVTDSATGEKISVISGDSDTKGANGLPIRQGYNLPDIGANPAPLLISGGSIA
jgi:hypothetical protein